MLLVLMIIFSLPDVDINENLTINLSINNATIISIILVPVSYIVGS